MRLIAALALLLVACADPPPEQLGNPEVYTRIDTTSDCPTLQREFDVAMTNAEAREPGNEQRKISLAYAKAADARLKEVGCYK